eukprot:12546251-Prorocentrum_lima.AAC.1
MIQHREQVGRDVRVDAGHGQALDTAAIVDGQNLDHASPLAPEEAAVSKATPGAVPRCSHLGHPNEHGPQDQRKSDAFDEQDLQTARIQQLPAPNERFSTICAQQYEWKLGRRA